MTRLKFHSPPLSQSLDILWTYFHNFFFSFSFNRDFPKQKNLTLHSTLQSLFQVSFQVQLSFQVKPVVSGVICSKLCVYLVWDEGKGRKREFLCSFGLIFFIIAVCLLNKITGQFRLQCFVGDKLSLFDFLSRNVYPSHVLFLNFLNFFSP